MFKRKKQLVRFIEDAAIHLAILLVLFGIAGVSSMAASHLSTRAATATMSFSLTVTDSDNDDEEDNSGGGGGGGGGGGSYNNNGYGDNSGSDYGDSDDHNNSNDYSDNDNSDDTSWHEQGAFFDESFNESPSLMDRILAPIRKTFRSIADELFRTVVKAENLTQAEAKNSHIIIDESKSRFEIRVPISRIFTPIRRAVIDESMVPKERIRPLTRVIEFLLLQPTSHQIKKTTFVAYTDDIKMREITETILAGRRIILTSSTKNALEQSEELPAGTVILRANFIEESIKPIAALSLDGQSILLVEMVKTLNGQFTAQPAVEGTEPIIIIRPQDILRAIDEGVLTDEKITALAQSAQKEIVIPLSSHRYPRLNLLLLGAIILATILAIIKHREYTHFYNELMKSKYKRP